jgi:hypothetical protein
MDFDYRLFFIAVIQGILFWPAFELGFLSVSRKCGVSHETKSLKDFMYTILAALSGCLMLALVILLPVLIVVRIPLQNRLNFFSTYGITLLVGMLLYRIVQYFLKKREQ